MFDLLFRRDVNGAPRILLLGAHSDDIEIGAGGTVLRLLETYPAASVLWVVFSAPGVRAQEAQASAELFLAGAGDKQIVVKSFRESFFPYVGAEVKEYFEELKRQMDPDLIFTQFRDDLHQDHRTICECTWNAFRDHTILEYEIPKWDGDMGRPNLYVPLSEGIATTKVRNLMQCFASQTGRRWFSEDTFLALLRLRGVESQETYAEAFYSRKLVLGAKK